MFLGLESWSPPFFFCKGEWESSPNVMEPVSSNPQNKNPSQMYEVGSCSYELKDGKMFVIRKQSADVRCDYITICCITSFIHPPHTLFFLAWSTLIPWLALIIFRCMINMLMNPHSTYMQSTSQEMLGWKKQKLEPRLLGEISITSDMQMTPPLW